MFDSATEASRWQRQWRLYTVARLQRNDSNGGIRFSSDAVDTTGHAERVLSQQPQQQQQQQQPVLREAARQQPQPTTTAPDVAAGEQNDDDDDEDEMEVAVDQTDEGEETERVLIPRRPIYAQNQHWDEAEDVSDENASDEEAGDQSAAPCHLVAGASQNASSSLVASSSLASSSLVEIQWDTKLSKGSITFDGSRATSSRVEFGMVWAVGCARQAPFSFSIRVEALGSKHLKKTGR